MDTFSLAPASRRGFSCGLAIAVLRPLLYIWAGVPPDPPPRHLGTLRPRLRNPGAFLCRRGFSCARHATERFGTKFTSENWNCWRGGHPYTPVHPPRLLLKLGPAPTERGLFLRWRQSALVQVHQARPMNRPRCWERFPTVLIFRRDCHVEHYERRRDKNRCQDELELAWTHDFLPWGKMSCSSSVERKAEESCDAHHTLVESCDAHHTEAIAGLARRSWRRRYLGIGSDVSMGISWTLLRWFLALASRAGAFLA